MSAESAKALHDRQRRYDELHHRMRLEWLASNQPKFVCGALVPKWDVLNLKTGSHECLRLIQQHGMSTNSVSMGDTEYIAELDSFAARSE